MIVSGPSGSGKSTICKVLGQHPQVWISISATTRRKRSYEEEGKHYYFLEKETFEEWIGEGRFIEHAEILNRYYGTPLAPVEEKVRDGRIVLLDIDIQGQAILKEKGLDCVSIFILPPNMEILEERLRSRKTEKEEEIQRRLDRAKKEMERASLYDYQVVNDDLPQAVERVCAILKIPGGKWIQEIEILKGW